nr:hypothetical protein [Tanacetum cinerariifolium]
MASFDYRLNPLYPIKECSSCGALYTTDYCCSDGSLRDKIICDLAKTPDLSQRPPQNCPKCENPVDGHYCQGCALLRKKFKEDLFTCCIENGILQDSFEPSDDNTNVVVEQDPEKRNQMDYVKTFLRKFNRISFYKMPKVLSLAWDTILEIKLAFEDKHCQPKDILELFRRLHNDEQNIHEELAVYINTPNWYLPTICYSDDDDDEDYAIEVTPILSTEETDNSLSMGDEHLDTISATESNEFIRSSVESLVSIPSESEGIPDNMCDMPFHDNSPPLDILKDQFKDFSDSNDESTSIDDDSFSIDNIYGSTTTRSDISLPDYEAFYDNHVKEINSDSTTTHSDYSLYDSFIFNLSINPFSPTDRSDFYEFADELAHIISPSEYDCFCFKNEPNSGNFTMDEVEDIFPTREPIVHVHNALPTHPNCQLNMEFILSRESLFAYVIWIFLSFLSYSVDPQYLLSFGNEDTIFDPDICSYHTSSFMSDVSHRMIAPPTTQTDTIVIPTETPIIASTIPPPPDYAPASLDYSPASEIESDPSEDPSSGHIPPLPVVSPFLLSNDDTTDSDTPDTPPSPTHGTLFTKITASTQRSLVIPRHRVMILVPRQPIPHGRPYRYHPNGPVHMMTARKKVGPLPVQQLAMRHSVDHSSSDSSSRQSLSDHSSHDLPSTLQGHLARDVIEGVQREQGHRIVGVESAVTALTERVAELERDNMRLRDTASVESQRVDRLQRDMSRVQREMKPTR